MVSTVPCGLIRALALYLVLHDGRGGEPSQKLFFLLHENENRVETPKLFERSLEEKFGGDLNDLSFGEPWTAKHADA